MYKNNYNYIIIHISIVVIILIKFSNLNMPIIVFGNSSSSHNIGNKIDNNIFLQTPCLRTKYIENIIKEDIDLKNKYRIKILPDPISIREACNKKYVDKLCNHPSII